MFEVNGEDLGSNFSKKDGPLINIKKVAAGKVRWKFDLVGKIQVALLVVILEDEELKWFKIVSAS